MQCRTGYLFIEMYINLNFERTFKYVFKIEPLFVRRYSKIWAITQLSVLPYQILGYYNCKVIENNSVNKIYPRNIKIDMIRIQYNICYVIMIKYQIIKLLLCYN